LKLVPVTAIIISFQAANSYCDSRTELSFPNTQYIVHMWHLAREIIAHYVIDRRFKETLSYEAEKVASRWYIHMRKRSLIR